MTDTLRIEFKHAVIALYTDEPVLIVNDVARTRDHAGMLQVFKEEPPPYLWGSWPLCDVLSYNHIPREEAMTCQTKTNT